MQLASIEKVVDMMCMKGHSDQWCKEHCDPATFPALKKYWLNSLTFWIHYIRLENVTKCRDGRSVTISII